MNATMTAVSNLLSDAGYSIGALETEQGAVTTFENNTVLGFILYYPNAETLIEEWRKHSSLVLDHAQFALRTAGQKAWNTYLVLLADQMTDYGADIVLG